MHTLRIIAVGLGVLVACLLGARALLGARTAFVARACRIFIPVWCLAALANLWVGVTRAGYTLLEELPIFVLVFGVPAAVASVLWWRASRPRGEG